MWFYNGVWNSEPPTDDEAEQALRLERDNARRLAEYRQHREAGEPPGAAMARVRTASRDWDRR